MSELARNIYRFAKSGTITVSLSKGRIRIVAVDQGPGIPDPDGMLSGTTAGRRSGGLGLRGSQRLADTFEIQSSAARGTRITAELPLQ